LLGIHPTIFVCIFCSESMNARSPITAGRISIGICGSGWGIVWDDGWVMADMNTPESVDRRDAEIAEEAQMTSILSVSAPPR
jgi:hypothetical protein